MKKKTGLIMVLVLVLALLVGGVTYAFYEWLSSDNTDVTFDVEGISIKYSGGPNFSTGDLEKNKIKPVASYDQGISKKIEVQLDSDQVITPTPTMTLYMDLTEFPSPLADASFKWEVYFNDETTPLATGNFLGMQQGDTITLVSERTISNEKDIYEIFLWIDGNEENDSNMQGHPFKFTIHASGANASDTTKFEQTSFANDIIALSKTNTSEILTVTHAATTQVSHETKDYRFYGEDPNNYVYFNCSVRDGSNNLYMSENYDYANSCELWRVIGVFETETPIYSDNTITGYTLENRVKLIREQSIGNYSFDSSLGDVNNGMGINAWEQADIMTTLNNGAYWNRTTGTCFNTFNNGTVGCDFSTSGLTTIAQSLVADAKYYLGGSYLDRLASDLYISERGNVNKVCSDSDTCNDTVTRQTSWTGVVGLMYPSDYGYAAGSTCFTGTYLNQYHNTCKNSDWLHINSNQWTMSSYLDRESAATVLNIYATGELDSMPALSASAVRPVVYLFNLVARADGDGTRTSPWKIR